MYKCLGPPFSAARFSGFPVRGFLSECRALGSSRLSKAIAVNVGMVPNEGFVVQIAMEIVGRRKRGERIFWC